MIVEGKRLTAFDVMEAVMKLSDVYHENGAKEFVSFSFHAITEVLVVNFGRFVGYECDITKTYRVYLDDLTIGDSFSDVFEEIERELDRMSEIKKEKENVFI